MPLKSDGNGRRGRPHSLGVGVQPPLGDEHDALLTVALDGAQHRRANDRLIVGETTSAAAARCMHARRPALTIDGSDAIGAKGEGLQIESRQQGHQTTSGDRHRGAAMKKRNMAANEKFMKIKAMSENIVAE